MRSVGAAARAGAVVVGGLLVLAACTGGDDPDPGPATPSAEETEAADGWTREDLTAAVFEGDIGTSQVLGTAEGQVVGPSSAFPASVEVTEVHAGSSSTLVRFTLRNVDDSDPLLPLEGFNARTPLTRDVRDIALVDAAANVRLQPFLAVPQSGERNESFCTCAAAPLQMSQEGQLLSATFPPLDAGTTTVSLELPNFSVIEDLPVTRD